MDNSYSLTMSKNSSNFWKTKVALAICPMSALPFTKALLFNYSLNKHLFNLIMSIAVFHLPSFLHHYHNLYEVRSGMYYQNSRDSK